MIPQNNQEFMLVCKICVDNNRKWKKMNKLSLKQHYMTLNSSHNKSHRKILHHNVKHLGASELSLGYHYYHIKNGKVIYAPPSTAHCPKCMKMTQHQVKIFKWSTCQHIYCFECACSLVNTSLSNNQIPRCCYPECNNILHITDTYHFKSTTSKMYKYYTKTIIRYEKRHHVFYGYIRNQLTQFKLFVPKEIIVLMFDYYALYFLSKIDCKECDLLGHTITTKKCHLCKGTGQIGINCKLCKSKGIIKYVTGKCRYCNGSESACGKCNATGKRFGSIVCRKCSGRGKTYELCSFCDSNNTEQIRESCAICDGNKYLLGLDFNSICNKQLLCKKCNHYFPSSWIIYWPGCCHVFCFNCFLDCIQPMIEFYMYALCLGCGKRLTVDDMKLLHYKHGFNRYVKLGNLKNRFITAHTKITQLIAMGYKDIDSRVGLCGTKGNVDLTVQMISQKELYTAVSLYSDVVLKSSVQ